LEAGLFPTATGPLIFFPDRHRSYHHIIAADDYQGGMPHETALNPMAIFGPGERIRTSAGLLPRQVGYLTSRHPDMVAALRFERSFLAFQTSTLTNNVTRPAFHEFTFEVEVLNVALCPFAQRSPFKWTYHKVGGR
jgi:hypothetical protein